jgi:UDP-2-acetamido-2,6-beta-L-arabino-hexul-4-ose reductase
VGTHLYMLLFPEKFERIDFKKSVCRLNWTEFAFAQCDVIVHLAAWTDTMTHKLYMKPILICSKLIKSLEQTKSESHILFSSSTQEEKENLYGKSKKRSWVTD